VNYEDTLTVVNRFMQVDMNTPELRRCMFMWWWCRWRNIVHNRTFTTE